MTDKAGLTEEERRIVRITRPYNPEVCAIIDRLTASPKAVPDSTPTAEPPKTDEVAWLIELKPSVSATPTYYGQTDEGVIGWTSDNLRAVRFSRREDAERVISCEAYTEAFACEHMWVASGRKRITEDWLREKLDSNPEPSAFTPSTTTPPMVTTREALGKVPKRSEIRNILQARYDGDTVPVEDAILSLFNTGKGVES